MYERYMKTTHIYLWLFSKTETIWKWKINCDIEHFIKTGKLKSPNWWCQVSVFNVILAVRRDMTSTQTYTHVASTATMSFLSCVPLTTEKWSGPEIVHNYWFSWPDNNRVNKEIQRNMLFLDCSVTKHQENSVLLQDGLKIWNKIIEHNPHSRGEIWWNM